MIPVEEIERVIDVYETKGKEMEKKSRSSFDMMWYGGAAWAFDYAVQELRKVLSDYGPRKS